MRPLLSRLRGDDDGFTLVEVVIAFALLSVVMVAATSLIVRSVTTADSLSERQTAAALADQALDATRGVQAANLARGRTQAAIAALRAPGTTLVNTSIDDTTSAAAIAATTGTGTVALPTSTTTKVGSATYTVKTFIEACWLADTLSGGTTTQLCGPVRASGTRLAYRITAEVTWPRVGRSCRGPNATTCSYDTTTLRDPSVDPVFPATLSAPTLSSRSPSGTLPRGQTVQVTLTGTNFQQGAMVSEAGSGSIGTTTLTATTASFPFTADSTAGTYTFALTNPDGGRTNSVNVTVGTSTPSVSSVSVVGADGTTTCRDYTACLFTVTGDDFYSAGGQLPSVSLYPYGNSTTYPVANVTLVSASKLTFTATPNQPNTYNTRVVLGNPDGGSATGSVSWAVSTSSPTITSVAVNSAGGASTCRVNTNCTFTVTGSGYWPTPGITLYPFGNSTTYPVGGVTFVNGSTVTFTTNPSGAGTYNVRIVLTDPDGGTASFTGTWTVSS